MKQKVWSIITVFVFGMALTACGDRFPDYHYKMTIHAGGKAFSSVRAVEQEEVSTVLDSTGRTVKRSMRGEAVIIDHPDGHTYYALLGKPGNPDYATLIVGAALRDYIPQNQPKSDVERELAEMKATEPDISSGDNLRDMAERSRAMTEVEGPHDLPRRLPPRNGRPPFEAWPMFVTFSDPSDPKTVREVSPESIGVSRITIEITDEDVTTGIEQRLPQSLWHRWVEIHRQELSRPGGLKANHNNPYFDSLLAKLDKTSFVIED
ncbi:MAG: hypothetical protein CMK03_06910 [Ponticaulis sp.]|nr:hypothetical protein [Ponticaulis sp.]